MSSFWVVLEVNEFEGKSVNYTLTLSCFDFSKYLQNIIRIILCKMEVNCHLKYDKSMPGFTFKCWFSSYLDPSIYIKLHFWIEQLSDKTYKIYLETYRLNKVPAKCILFEWSGGINTWKIKSDS